MNNLFSNEKVNVGRQVELDIAKALSIIFMIFLHTIMVVKGFNVGLSSAYDFIFSNILGRPYAAPIFMFCMGVGIVYSRHSQWDVMIKRGIKLYLLGILVNIFEFFIPHFLCGNLLGVWDVFPISGGLLLFCVDILAFAGLAFILMGILKKFELSNRWMIVVAVVLSLLGTLLKGTDFGNDILNLVAANFIGSAGGFSAFPLFNWFIFPVAGYIWGQYFIRAKDKGEFFKFWPLFIIAGLTYFFISTHFCGGVLSENIHLYYFMTILDAVFCIINAHGVIGFCWWVMNYLPYSIVKFFSILSSNINQIYIAQWFFIPVAVILVSYFFRDLVLSDLVTSIIAILMLLVSTAVAFEYKKLKG